MKLIKTFENFEWSKLLTIQDSTIQGKGLFTESDIPKGQIICLIGDRSIREKNSDNWITKFGHSINHNSYPNTEVIHKGDKYYLKSIEDIKSGEEITTDYEEIPSVFNKKIYEELTGKYKEETEIIYKDKNIVCLIPKSQMTSSIYGQKTKWCQVSQSGFEGWSGKGNPKDTLGLLIRFLFKNGRKIRFTYFITNHFHWSNETGYHLLMGDGNNPFDVKPPDRIRDLEKDILDQIKLIPQECKDKVLEFIEKNKKDYKYIYRDTEYYPDKIDKARKEFERILSKWAEEINHIKYGYGSQNFISIRIKREGNMYIQWREGPGWLPDNQPVNDTHDEEFKPNQVKDFETRLEELINKLSV